MAPRLHKAFTLIEIVAIVALISVLVGIGIWRTGTIRSESQSLAKKEALAVVQRMEALAQMEQLQVTEVNTVERLINLQTVLSAKGHAYYQFDPAILAQMLNYNNGTWEQK